MPTTDRPLADCRLMLATPIYDGAQGSYVRAVLDLALKAQAAGASVRFEYDKALRPPAPDTRELVAQVAFWSGSTPLHPIRW